MQGEREKTGVTIQVRCQGVLTQGDGSARAKKQTYS